jgi:hypothetical protein
VVCLLSLCRGGGEVEILIQIPLVIISLTRQLGRVLQAFLLFCRGRGGGRGLELVFPKGMSGGIGLPLSINFEHDWL